MFLSSLDYIKEYKHDGNNLTVIKIVVYFKQKQGNIRIFNVKLKLFLFQNNAHIYLMFCYILVDSNRKVL